MFLLCIALWDILTDTIPDIIRIFNYGHLPFVGERVYKQNFLWEWFPEKKTGFLSAANFLITAIL